MHMYHFSVSSHRQKPPKRPKPIVNLANTHRKVSSLKVYEVPLDEFIGRQCNVELIVKVFYCLSLAKYDLNIASSRRSVIWGTARKTAREKINKALRAEVDFRAARQLTERLEEASFDFESFFTTSLKPPDVYHVHMYMKLFSAFINKR